MKRIGLFGGTFNPIHTGHLILAEEARIKADLSKVIFMPAGDPPHKSGMNIIKKEHRYNMVKLAVEDNLYFEVSDLEIYRKGKSYTYETIKTLKNLYPEDVLYLIIGFDTLISLNTWKSYESMLRSVNVIAANRGNDKKLMEETVESMNKRYKSSIEIIDIPDVKISSSDIRNRIAEGMGVRYLIPEKVADYIDSNNLYK